ncbi:hypothetical protein XFLAVUS301_13200 [Xanthobacter flavus]|uniref:Uncharacterized protein n=1 Tax=Xanthobacter flavus TaxID=281 RepID=A0A9W6FIX6_XANFL|nr:hypothetical protein XFLAVUS301_13200 [Xanthobacter flavus]
MMANSRKITTLWNRVATMDFPLPVRGESPAGSTMGKTGGLNQEPQLVWCVGEPLTPARR